MSFQRWSDVKKVTVMKQKNEMKWCESGYDPMQKYCLALTFTMAQYIKRSGLDVTVDETTWANSLCADI